VHHRSTEFRCSIFPNKPPSDPPPTRLRSINRSRLENRPRKDDQQPQIASSSPISISALLAIRTHQELAMAAHAVHLQSQLIWPAHPIRISPQWAISDPDREHQDP
ncbi:hypothetical protein ACLOJK_006796, partial [Asimina triloba]